MRVARPPLAPQSDASGLDRRKVRPTRRDLNRKTGAGEAGGYCATHRTGSDYCYSHMQSLEALVHDALAHRK